MLKIWGRATSSNVQVAIWCIAELGLEYQRIDAGGKFGGLDTPEYLAMNPNAKIPTLKDGDFVLSESHVIVRYLAAKHGDDGFWPADLQRRAQIDMWMDWVKCALGPEFNYGVFWQIWRTAEKDRDPARIAAALAETGRLLEIVEARLDGREYLEGDTLTPADMAVGTQLYRYYTLPIERPDLPNLAAYYERLCARPAYAAHVMVDYSPLRVV